MLIRINGTRPSSLVVIAYDITSPQRARHVREILDSLQHAKQYSVYEVMLGEGKFRGVLAEVSTCCDFSSDLLAVWRPFDGLRLRWRQDQLIIDARNGESCQIPAILPPNIGNFICCYDISDLNALRAVADEVAGEAVAIQRSVYWLSMNTENISTVLARCQSYLNDDDRLWVYPLRGSRDLWYIGTQVHSILPIATYHWRAQ